MDTFVISRPQSHLEISGRTPWTPPARGGEKTRDRLGLLLNNELHLLARYGHAQVSTR
jgi:hypothetical protein